jgi:hypothetical protein
MNIIPVPIFELKGDGALDLREEKQVKEFNYVPLCFYSTTYLFVSNFELESHSRADPRLFPWKRRNILTATLGC